MIQSMTGYGKAVIAYKEKKIHVEVKSLNSKQLDLSTRIAPLYREKEMEMRQIIAKALERGKVDFALWIEKENGTDAATINSALVENYYQQIKSIAQKTGIPEPENWFSTLLRMPDVTTKTEAEVLEEEEWEAAKQAVYMALSQLQEFRLQEGRALFKMFSEKIDNIEVIPSGSIALDYALGVGGYPRGRIVEIYGPESSGKTTLAIHAIAEAQKQGGIAAFIDAEHAFDRFYAANLGVNVDELLISQPDNGEQALDIADQLIRSAAVDIIVIDSVAALTPKAEIEGDMGDNKVGLQARLMSQALRKLTSTISKTNTTCIFINQLREKIGVMFGNPETTTGGNALKFYASVRLDIRKSSPIKDGDEVVGNEVKVKVVKNKVAPPFRRAEFEVMYGEGISRVGEVVDLGVNFGILEKSGSWYSYGGSKLGQGKEATKAVLRDNPELQEEVTAKIYEAMKAGKA